MRSAHSCTLATLAIVVSLGLSPAIAGAKTTFVSPGQSIQDAIDAASPGDTIKVQPGDYVENHGGTYGLRVTKSLKLIGLSKPPATRVRLLPGPGQTNGIVIEPEVPGVDPDVEKVTVQGFTVEGFSNHGIWLQYVNKFKIIKNESINNLHNGIFPTLSANGLVKRNVSYGALDAALWVEASENVRVIRNELHTSPTGLEITVSKKIQAKKNHVYNNVVGVGLYHPEAASLPPLGDDGDWDIINNYVHSNNLPNPVSGGLVGELPSGGGVLLLGVDRVNLRKNEIVDNDFFGIAVIDFCAAVGCGSPPAVDSAANENSFIKNEVVGNAGNPPSGGFGALASDIIYLGAADGTSCMSNNTYDTFVGTHPGPC